MKTHKREWKELQLKELKELAEKYPIIAIANLEGFPANLFADVRKKLAGKAVVKVSKTRIVKRALSTSSKKDMTEHANRSVAVIFTEMNPFKLYNYLKKNKGKAPAKPGQIAPIDITIPAGDTGLPPGPALSDLKAAGLPVKIQGSTIEISKDTVVAKAGEPIKPAVASVLSKLDIKPIEIGLNIVAAFEDGLIYKADVLDVDAEQLYANFVTAHRNAFALCTEIGYITRDTLPFLIQKAFRSANALALEAGIYTEDTIPVFLARADTAAKEIKSHLTGAPQAEEKKEEAKPEEKKEKPKEEKKEKAKEEPKTAEKPKEKEKKPKKQKPEPKKAPETTKKEAPKEKKKGKDSGAPKPKQKPAKPKTKKKK